MKNIYIYIFWEFANDQGNPDIFLAYAVFSLRIVFNRPLNDHA